MNIKTDKRRVLERNIAEEIRLMDNGQTLSIEIKKDNENKNYIYTLQLNKEYGEPFKETRTDKPMSDY